MYFIKKNVVFSLCRSLLRHGTLLSNEQKHITKILMSIETRKSKPFVNPISDITTNLLYEQADDLLKKVQKEFHEIEYIRHKLINGY